MTIKNEVLVRVYIVLGVVLLVSLAIIYKAVEVSVIEGESWRQKSANQYVKLMEIEGDRGNILSEDGKLLATSLPFYDIGFDPNSSGMSDKDFLENVDSLAYCIAEFANSSRTFGGWHALLMNERGPDGTSYIPIKRNATYDQMHQIKQFPLFNKGQFRGGFVAKQKFDRKRPFGLLARRTVGYIDEESGRKVGLEGSYDKYLRGEVDSVLMFKVDPRRKLYKPLYDYSDVKLESGLDVVTTIDVDLQDIVEESLHSGLVKHQAEYGVAIIMEVKTGEIKAIANLSRQDDGNYYEEWNNAVGTKTEPGSTFKIASMMALLEAGYIDLDDEIDITQGVTEYEGERMKDSSPHGLDTVTVRHAFEISSNVGVSQLVVDNFGKRNKEKAFINYLDQFRLTKPTGVEIMGEQKPYIKHPDNEADDWSGITLPWMSIGYESELTPLQILNFYNAIANDGMMMKPQLVTSTQKYGQTIERFPHSILKKKIASSGTIKKTKELLEGVVLNGTAEKYQSKQYTFAGKTGTAQFGYRKRGNYTEVEGRQASFAGYFPAHKPKYSIIVVVNDPKIGGYYGSKVALPIFRAIADKTWALKLDMHYALNARPAKPLAGRQLPNKSTGVRDDVKKVLASLDLKYNDMSNSELAVLEATRKDTVNLYRRKVAPNKVPNVVGMGLRDALYVLENKGLTVEFRGVGKVRNQSIAAGTRIRGQTIKLRLE